MTLVNEEMGQLGVVVAAGVEDWRMILFRDEVWWLERLSLSFQHGAWGMFAAGVVTHRG